MIEDPVSTVSNLSLDELVIDAGFQVRAGGLNHEHVNDLAEALEAGLNLPPVKVCRVEEIGNIITDGFHTVEAHRRCGRKEVPCLLSQGTRTDAVLAAATANRQHDQSGLKRTNADKRQAVQLILTCVKDWSDHRIADHVGVSHTFVGTVRREQSSNHQLETDSSSPSSESLREGADGKSRRPKHLAPRADAARNPSSPKGRGEELPSKELSWRNIDQHFGRLVRSLDELVG